MKTYTQLREQKELQERRLLRTGRALVFGAKVREVGKRVESDISSAEGKFNRAKQIDDINEKLNAFLDGMGHLSSAVKNQRFMMGNLAGLGVVSALTHDRSYKELQKISKGKKRR